MNVVADDSGPRGPVGPKVDLGGIRESLEANTAGMVLVADRMADAERRAKRDRRIYLLLLALLVLVSGFGVRQTFVASDQAHAIRSQQRVNERTFQQVLSVTSPAAQAAQAKAFAVIITELEHCIINHVDHDSLGTPLDPKCPAS